MDPRTLKEWASLNDKAPMAVAALQMFPKHAEHVIESVGIMTCPTEGTKWMLHCQCGSNLSITERDLLNVSMRQ